MRHLFLALLLSPLLAQPALAQEVPAGTWRGTYTCYQGETGLTLTVRPDARAVFHFYPLPGNPAAAEGCFEMQALPGRDGAVELVAGRWLLRPPGYVAVDLSGEVSGDGSSLSGRVVGPGCTSFVLRRGKADTAPGAAACRATGPVSSRD